MQITHAGDHDRRPGPAAYFTGAVTLDSVPTPGAPARCAAAIVTFQPGARTHWHTHPLGQTLVILSGQGLAQIEGGPVRRLSPGDTLWFAPDERHWHGAAPDSTMTHLAVQEAQDGIAVDWKDPVSDADYTSPPAD